MVTINSFQWDKVFCCLIFFFPPHSSDSCLWKQSFLFWGWCFDLESNKGFVCSHGRGGEHGSWPTTTSFLPFPEHHWLSFLLFPLFPNASRVRVHPLGVLLIPSWSFQTHPVPLLFLPTPFHYNPVPHHVDLILGSYVLQNSLWSSG